MQPLSMPPVDKHLIGRKLAVCFEWNLEEAGTGLMLSQGEVVNVSDGTNILKPGARLMGRGLSSGQASESGAAGSVWRL